VQKAAGMGEQSASLKLTEQIITDLLCCLNVFQRNLFRGTPYVLNKYCGALRPRFLAFDIVHAVEFSRIGRTQVQAGWAFVLGQPV
ncbi:hypothetical protein, partial [Cryobacterium sp. Sr8]|uniref:hypothetical protein n=1 Tax=Cryobacterium sp. Sr8 TaxID=1259203 RepID=UPI001A7F1039